MNQRIFLTQATGRCGTNKLQSILATVPGVHAEFQTDPPFYNVRIPMIVDPSIGREFVKAKLEMYSKLPYQNISVPGHVPGSHFIEHFLDNGVVPNIIILRRPPREVALSLFNLRWIPGKNKHEGFYFNGPDEKGSLPFPNWETAHTYQICYWYCCEIERRIQLYQPILKAVNAKVWNITLADMLVLDKFNAMLEYFELPLLNTIDQEVVHGHESYIGEVELPPTKLLDQLESEVLKMLPADLFELITSKPHD